MLRILFHLALTLLLIWAMSVYLPEYFILTGGWKGLLIVSALILVLNVIVTPVLNILLTPLRLLAGLLAILIANAVFLWVAVWVVSSLSISGVALQIRAGWMGWLVCAIVLGLGKWLMRLVLR